MKDKKENRIDKLKELKIMLTKTYGSQGNPQQRSRIRKEIARLKTKENEKNMAT